jgi:hypothetical protein
VARRGHVRERSLARCTVNGVPVLDVVFVAAILALVAIVALVAKGVEKL